MSPLPLTRRLIHPHQIDDLSLALFVTNLIYTFKPDRREFTQGFNDEII